MFRCFMIALTIPTLLWAEAEAPAATEAEAPAAETVIPAEEAALPERVARNPVALVKAGPIDDALMQRLKSWAENVLAIPAPFAESLDTTAESMDAVAEEAAARLRPEDLGVVVFLAADHDLPNHGIYREDLRVVVVNANLMKKDVDEETYARRMDRQVIRGIAMLMGLETSPNPESAMAFYSTMEELDQIGRNLDPPWLHRLQLRARELGIPLDPENPMNLLRE